MLVDENLNYIQGQTGLWESVMGLEVHAQVTSACKLFSQAGTYFDRPPNTQVDLLDVAFPGILPVVNMACVHQAIKTGLALNATIHPVSLFDRKNYFYPDLPQGYQISQFYHPIVTEGFIEIDVPYPNDPKRTYEKKIRIERLHLEQDAGKTIHDQHPTLSLLDFNRAGIALMEIVSKPDLRSADEVKAYVKKLQLIMRTIGTCDGNMEEGSLRVDVNISVRRVGDKAFGTRCEIKNVNSFKAIDLLIDFETHRHIEELEHGHTIPQETRSFDAKSGETKSMRLKEDAQDYRYMPDPDLRPLVIADETIRALKASLPELPDAKKSRFIRDHGLTSYEATLLTQDHDTSLYFEHVVQTGVEAKRASNWIMSELFALLNKDNLAIAASPLPVKYMSELLLLLQQDSISGPIAKKVFKRSYDEKISPLSIIQQDNLFQISNPSDIEAVINAIIEENPTMVAQAHDKPDKIKTWLAGQVMKKTDGRAKPQLVQEMLSKKLGL